MLGSKYNSYIIYIYAIFSVIFSFFFPVVKFTLTLRNSNQENEVTFAELYINRSLLKQLAYNQGEIQPGNYQSDFSMMFVLTVLTSLCLVVLSVSLVIVITRGFNHGKWHFIGITLYSFLLLIIYLNAVGLANQLIPITQTQTVGNQGGNQVDLTTSYDSSFYALLVSLILLLFSYRIKIETEFPHHISSHRLIDSQVISCEKLP
ncbi:MAG: hypothetical protein IH840_03695 [Candidatus Heimdallarchaeota archaeon]|nr:hypothetical protein [Candidatus Heimdallarchaeota archaeon]